MHRLAGYLFAASSSVGLDALARILGTWDMLSALHQHQLAHPGVQVQPHKCFHGLHHSSSASLQLSSGMMTEDSRNGDDLSKLNERALRLWMCSVVQEILQYFIPLLVAIYIQSLAKKAP